MIIKELYKEYILTESTEYVFVDRRGKSLPDQAEILNEHLIDVYVNDVLTMKLVCLPQYMTELVLGRLLTEGIIRSAEDIELIYIGQDGERVDVELKDKEPLQKDAVDYVEITQTCCTSNHILNDMFVHQRDVLPVKPIAWRKEWVFRLADVFAVGTPLHGKTYATHSAFLAKENMTLFACEDVGRHNAIDKVIGYALRNNIDLKQCIVYSSGRVSSDMVMKVIRAGVPIFCSKASVTAEAVELARHYKLTLIASSREDSMKQYSGPEWGK